MDAPTVKLTLRGREHVVVFDFDRLVAIEAATGRTVLQVLSEFATYSPEGSSADERRAAAERFSLTTVGRFVAGCLGVAPAQVGTVVSLAEIRDAFVALIDGFIDATKQLNGQAEEPAADPTPAPPASAA